MRRRAARAGIAGSLGVLFAGVCVASLGASGASATTTTTDAPTTTTTVLATTSTTEPVNMDETTTAFFSGGQALVAAAMVVGCGMSGCGVIVLHRFVRAASDAA